MVWDAISSLSKQEGKKFLQFLNSPFFYTRPDLPAIAEFLLRCKSNQIPPTGPQIWVAIGKTEPYQDQTMRLLLSELLGQLEQMFVELEQSTDEIELETLQARAYLRRGLQKHFQKTLRQATQSNENQIYRHSDYYAASLKLAWLQYQFDSNASRTGDYNLQALSDLTDQSYALNKLRVACLQASHQKTFNTVYDFGALNMVMTHVEERKWTAIPAIGLYYYCYRFMTQTESETNFQAYNQLLRQHAALFPTDELRTLFLLAINYAIKKVNEGKEDWFAPTLGLYKDALERQLLLENGILSRFAFTNIVAIALRSGDTEWAKTFIENYQVYLEKKYQQAIIHFNLARIAYAQRDYNQVLTLLQQADYKDILNNLIAKTLLLKVYYETKSFSSLESHLASMRIFIQRNKQLGYHQVNYLKLIKFTQLMVQMESTGKPTRQEFVTMIDKEEGLLEREWLLNNQDF
jgi:hypothetical protein